MYGGFILFQEGMPMSISRAILIIAVIVCLASSFSIFPQEPAFQSDPYNLANSKKYAAHSSITHCPKACIESWSCQTTAHLPKLVNVTYLENGITKAVGFVGYESSTESLIVSWRGSSNIQNWIEDFNFQTTPYEACRDCQIHTGFLLDYRSNEKRLLAAAQAIIKFYKVSKIICTGQSLGGALASVNGIQFVQKFPTIPVTVHNFGSPRIGNQKLSAYLKSKIPTVYRVVHNKDLVPHLPPEALSYHHNPFQVFFNEDMSSYKICNDSGEDKSCSDQFAPNYSTADHDFYFMPIGSPKC